MASKYNRFLLSTCVSVMAAAAYSAGPAHAGFEWTPPEQETVVEPMPAPEDLAPPAQPESVEETVLSDDMMAEDQAQEADKTPSASAEDKSSPMPIKVKVMDDATEQEQEPEQTQDQEESAPQDTKTAPQEQAMMPAPEDTEAADSAEPAITEEPVAENIDVDPKEEDRITIDLLNKSPEPVSSESAETEEVDIMVDDAPAPETHTEQAVIEANEPEGTQEALSVDVVDEDTVEAPMEEEQATPSKQPKKASALKINPFPMKDEDQKESASDKDAPVVLDADSQDTLDDMPVHAEPSASAKEEITWNTPESFEVIEGFGTDMPLVLALRQIVPASYAFSFGDNVNPGTRVSWEGGKPWNEVLADAIAPLDLDYKISGKKLRLTAPNAPASDLSPEPETEKKTVDSGAIEEKATETSSPSDAQDVADHDVIASQEIPSESAQEEPEQSSDAQESMAPEDKERDAENIQAEKEADAPENAHDDMASAEKNPRAAEPLTLEDVPVAEETQEDTSKQQEPDENDPHTMAEKRLADLQKAKSKPRTAPPAETQENVRDEAEKADTPPAITDTAEIARTEDASAETPTPVPENATTIERQAVLDPGQVESTQPQTSDKAPVEIINAENDVSAPMPADTPEEGANPQPNLAEQDNVPSMAEDVPSPFEDGAQSPPEDSEAQPLDIIMTDEKDEAADTPELTVHDMEKTTSRSAESNTDPDTSNEEKMISLAGDVPEVDNNYRTAPSGEIEVWEAKRGSDLREIAQRWSEIENVELIWDTEESYEIRQNVLINGTFRNAIEVLFSKGVRNGPDYTITETPSYMIRVE